MHSNINTLRIPVMSNEICAGAAVPDDWQKWQIKGFRDIRKVISSSPQDRFICVPVTGDSLKNKNIVHGDLLVVKLTKEYKQEKIGVWQTPHGRTAKYAYEDFDGTVVLHNQNGWSQKWQPDEVELIGIVVRVERDEV